MLKSKSPLCACGCGKPVKWCKQKKRWNTFLIGHCWKGTKRSTKWKSLKSESPLCKCGCGKPVIRSKNYPYDWNKYLCGHSASSPELRKKSSKYMKKLYKNSENHPNWQGGISKKFLGGKSYYQRNQESIRKQKLKDYYRSKKDLADSYIKRCLCAGINLRHADIPVELIAVKREQIKMKRLMKGLENENNERLESKTG